MELKSCCITLCTPTPTLDKKQNTPSGARLGGIIQFGIDETAYLAVEAVTPPKKKTKSASRIA